MDPEPSARVYVTWKEFSAIVNASEEPWQESRATVLVLGSELAARITALYRERRAIELVPCKSPPSSRLVMVRAAHATTSASRIVPKAKPSRAFTHSKRES